MKIAGVIVTYKRPEKLSKAIDSIYSGEEVPAGLFVVNNGDDPETETLLTQLQARYKSLAVLRTRDNLGGAGGFFVGLKAAYDSGATHFWLMDDDAYCQPDALERLLSAYEELQKDESIGFVCSRVNWTDGQICKMNQPETTWDWMCRFRQELPVVKVAACSFVSCFFSRSVVYEVGLPIKEFFIWFDDQEFTYRISKLYPSYSVVNSIVIHDMPTNQAADYGKIDDENLWKFRLGAANESWFQMRRKSFFHWLLFWAQKNWDMHLGRVSWRNRARVNLAILNGAFRRHRALNVQECSIDDLLQKSTN